MTAMSSLVQSVDWSKRGAEEWLLQYGLWVNDHSIKEPRGLVKRNSTKKKRNLVLMQHNLTDDEGRAVQRLLIELRQKWEDCGVVVIVKAEQDMTWARMSAISLRSQNALRQNYVQGVAWLRGRMGL